MCIRQDYIDLMNRMAESHEAAAVRWDADASHPLATEAQRSVFPKYAANCRAKAAEFRAEAEEHRKVA